MNVEVERGGYVGVTEKNTDSLVVAVALDAAGSERVTEAVELDRRNVERFHQPFVVAAISARLYRLGVIGYDIKAGVYYLHQRLDERKSFCTQWYLSDGVGCLGVVDYDFCMLLITFDNVDALDSAFHLECPGLCVDVLPAQGAYLTYSQSSG